MKKTIKISLLILLLIIMLLIVKLNSKRGLVVKFKDGKIISYVFSSSKINRFLENLPTCYDESYRYDKKNDITISRVEQKSKTIVNKINLKYEKGNLCDSEYILDESFISNFLDKADIEEISYEKCLKGKCKLIKVKNNLNKLLNEISKEEYIQENKNIPIKDNYEYQISVYYNMSSMSNILYIFEDNEYIILKNIDSNDHPKVIKYKLNKKIEKELKNII